MNLLAPILIIVAAFAAWTIDVAAKKSGPRGERGDLWVRVVWQTACIGVLMAVTTLAKSIPAFWRTGLHPQLDLVRGSRWAFPLAMAIPFVAWAVILLSAFSEKPTARDRSNWLAGSVGYGNARRWVFLCALPLLIPLLWVGWSRLNLGADGYPAGTWGTLAVLVISLFFLSRSEGTPEPQTAGPLAVAESEPPRLKLDPWPKAMTDAGIVLETVATFAPSGGKRQVARRAFELAQRLADAGARDVAPEVIETVHELLSPPVTAQGAPIYRLLFAPDDCGQIESIALAAGEIAATHRECTLIITCHADAAFARRLARWAPVSPLTGQPQAPVFVVSGESDLTHAPGIWLVDAATLSDDFLGRLADRTVAGRIGLVVWWNIHEYTGVLAANIWAISRRLHRLIVRRGRPDARTLVVVRDAFHAGAHMASFVRRLLPYPFPAEHEVHVQRQSARPVHVHLLRSQADFFNRNLQSPIPSRIRHPELVAALVSINHGWPTNLSAHSEITESECKEFVGTWVRGVAMRESLEGEVSESGARLLYIGEGDALAIREIAGQGGRALHPELPHHVGVTVADNPYIAWVLSRLREGQEISASRRLVGAEGQPSIFRRHLLLALSEQRDTRTGLMETLLWQEEVVERTLKEIAAQGKLTRHRVAFVADGNRKIEYLYKSTLARDSEKRPLDTVGEATVLIRPATEGIAPLRVDEARLAIRAYPGRIFLENGTRFRVRDWNRESRGWVEIQRTEEPARTWRMRTPQVKRIEKKGDERTTSDGGLLAKYYAVKLRYEEDVSGYIRRDYEFENGEHTDKLYRTPPLLTEFDTSGFVMEFSPEPDRAAIYSLCQALRHTIPVHLGVEEDAVEIVPLEGDYVGKRQVFGLVIVDLYPQGIGLVEAICDDPSWTTEIMRLTREWLSDVTSAMSRGGANPFRSPMARAATGGGEDPGSALELLRRVVGKETSLAAARSKGGL